LMPAPAATIPGRLIQAGQLGTAYGLIANPGDAAGKVSGAQLPDRLTNAVKSGGLAALTAGILESPGILKGAGKAGKDLIAKKLGQNIEFTPVANKDAIEAAAKDLGISSVPKAVLTDNPTYQKLESGLAQSGSFPAKNIREQYNQFFKAIDDASEKIASLKTPESDFALGQKIQEGLTKNVGDARAPVSKMYEDLTPHLKKIEVNPQVVNKQFGALKRNPLFQTKDGMAMLEEYKTAASQQPELASLKEWRSTLRDSVAPNASPLEAKRMDAISDAVTSIRDNSIHALKEHMPKEFHGEVDNLIDDISLADAAHSSNIKDINAIKGIVGNKDFKSPSTFVNKLGEMKESEIAQKASNLDVASFRNLKDKNPQVFETAKTARVNDMIQNSTNPVSGFSDARFLKQYQGLDQEMKDILFDPKMQSHINSLQTLRQAIPAKLGPSGTPEGQMLMDMFNPKRNALDFGIKKVLGSKPSAATVAPEASSNKTLVTNILKMVSSKGGAQNVSEGQFQRAAEREKGAPSELKGNEKWALDGFSKAIKHSGNDSLKDPATVEKLFTTSAGKKLLVAASDLTPGSKAMKDVVTKITALTKEKK
jgi:hypothetical protein